MRVARAADIEDAKLEITTLELVNKVKRLTKKIGKLEDRVSALEAAQTKAPKILTSVTKELEAKNDS